MSGYRRLVLATLVLAFVLVVVGAYVRLSDAGLGCPDWPLCYGQPVPTQMPDDLAHAKAWTEMGHRYLAAALGLLLLFVFFMSMKKRRSRLLAAALVLLVVFQATLGMWTVTMLLRPAIVTAHLLGGMATLALLVWLALQSFDFVADPGTRAVRFPAFAGVPQLAQHVESVGEVHRRQRLTHASRKIRAGERGVVRADPAAQRDLHYPCDKADERRKAYRTRSGVCDEIE